MSQAFAAAGRTLCAGCLEKMLSGQKSKPATDGITRMVDPTICVHCAADNGTAAWPELAGLPTCTKCSDFFRNRPFPNWLKISAVVFLCVAVAAFVYNWRFFMGYVEFLRGMRAIEREQVEQGVALLDSAARRVPEVPELAVVPNLLNAQRLLADDKSDEALALLAKSRPFVPDNLHDAFRQAESSAQMGVAFNRHDYDAFLTAAQALAESMPNEPAAIAAVAAAHACKFAATGDPAFHQQNLEQLERARSLAGADDAEFREYENRIQHRLATREIITKEQFHERFPDGWKPEASE
jgi:hypothetical protein